MMGAEASALRAAEGNASLVNKLKQAALRVDPAIDAAAINASIPDDAVHKATKKTKRSGDSDVSPASFNAILNVTNKARENQQQGNLVFVGGEEQQPTETPNRPVAKPAASQGGGFDGAVKSAESALGYVAFAPIATDMALPAVGWVLGKTGWKSAEATLNAPKHFLEKTHVTKNITARQAMNDGIQLGFSAFQTYGVAKGFSDNMASLKEMYADVTGKDARSISTIGMLTATNLPPLIAQARDHFIKEYGTRGLVQAVGWGLMARDLLRGKTKKAEDIAFGRIGVTAGILPSIIGMGVDMFMGTSTTEVYSGFKKAFDTGQPIPPNEYAAFILASSPDLAKRKVGKQVAMEIGTEYANEKASPGEILRQMNDGRFKARIEKLIIKDEAEAAQKAAAAPQKPHAVAHAKEPSMVERITGVKQDRPKIGKFTGMIHEENKGLTPSIT